MCLFVVVSLLWHNLAFLLSFGGLACVARCYHVEPFQTFLFNGQRCALHRMDLQRELAKVKGAKKDKGASSSASGTGGSGGKAGMNPEDADMLEMALGMLRCSVCKDRFKSCAITRYVKAVSLCCA
jgi:hypothetical protein